MSEIIKSTDLVKQIKQEIKEKVSKLNKAPELAFILVGEDYGSQVYVRNKSEACKEVGIKSHVYNLKEDATEESIIYLLELLNNMDTINGIIVQQPLPKHLDSKKIIETVNPSKDVDGFSNNSLAEVMKVGINGSHFSPATPLGIMKWIDYLNYDLKGKHVVIVGRSNTVSKPLSMMMLAKDATITICHSKTVNLKEITKQADVLVSAVGKANFITSDYVSDNTLIIDVGINRLPGGKLVGDCFQGLINSKENVTLTSVPGGVGPLTVTCLLYNTVCNLKE